MLDLARARTGDAAELVEGFAHATGLPDAVADVVTCAQSFHWMDPDATLPEVARLLRPGGVFSAYSAVWPPAVHWEAEAVWHEVAENARRIERDEGLKVGQSKWQPDGHLESVQSSGLFRYARWLEISSVEDGDGQRFADLLRSQAFVANVLAAGHADSELGLDRLDEVARRVIGDEPVPWVFGYPTVIAVR
jgi:SAM-dependent methyltransferase